MRILTVDDDPVVRRLVRRVLEDAGHEVAEAGSGVEGLEVWERERLPLVITDCLMPHMDGAALCRHIRQLEGDRYTYVIMLTVSETQDAIAAGFAAGADDYITKPFSRRELLMRVAAGVRLLELQDALAAKIAELQAALARVDTLEGLLPMCAYCKRIRDDAGHWHPVDAYIQERTDVSFSHGLCKDCYESTVLPELEQLRTSRSG